MQDQERECGSGSALTGSQKTNRGDRKRPASMLMSMTTESGLMRPKMRIPSFKLSTLRWIGLGTMVADHLYVARPGLSDSLSLVGRLSFPIFAYFLVRGARQTRNVPRYLGRLFLCALLAQFPFARIIGRANYFNSVFELTLGLLVLSLLHWRKSGVLVRAVLWVLAAWGEFTPAPRLRSLRDRNDRGDFRVSKYPPLVVRLGSGSVLGTGFPFVSAVAGASIFCAAPLDTG